MNTVLWLTLALLAQTILPPKMAQGQPPVAEKIPASSAPNSVVVETISATQEIAQTPTPTPTTPSTTPNQSTTDTDTPVNPPVPITPAPGTEGTPQQETPNQLEFDITPAIAKVTVPSAATWGASLTWAKT
jgi:outer membrane protein insertion porin family